MQSSSAGFKRKPGVVSFLKALFVLWYNRNIVNKIR